MALTAEQMNQLKEIASVSAKAILESSTANRTLPTRKPPTVRYELDDIDEYIVVWENFAKVKNLRQEERLQAFLTYLDPISQQKLENLELEEKPWNEALAIIRRTLENKMSTLEAKQLMLNAKQRDSESPVDFGFRMEQLSKKAYPENEKIAVRNENLSDCFIRGL